MLKYIDQKSDTYMCKHDQSFPETTVIGLTKPHATIMYIVLAILGGIIGFFMPQIGDWISNIPIVPLGDLIETISSYNKFWFRIVSTPLGLGVGIIVAYWFTQELLTIEISNQKVYLNKGNYQPTFAVQDIKYVFSDGKQLVILGKSGMEMTRVEHDEKIKNLAKVFQKHDFPWVDEDPYKEQFRRWVENTPDIPSAVNALMKAREKALQKEDEEDVEDLRNEILKLGFIVRDENTRQYWRRVKK